MSTEINTSKSLTKSGQASQDTINTAYDILDKSIVGGEIVSIAIPRSYKDYIGDELPIRINGLGVTIPCDGKTYKVPKAIADQAKIRLHKLDLLINKSNDEGVFNGDANTRLPNTFIAAVR